MNVIVTGASKGIGKAIASKFASQGHDLFLCSRSAGMLKATSDEISKMFPEIKVNHFSADLSVKKEVHAFADFCLQKGIPDILINNAGIYLPGNTMDEPEGYLELMMNTNLYSAYHLSRHLLPAMIKKQSGHIFNICSIASLDAYAGGGGYSISKFAMNGFNKNLRRELKPHGIKVTAVYPGAVLTDTWGDFDNSNNRIMEVNDIADMVYSAAVLSQQAVVDEIKITPQLGEL